MEYFLQGVEPLNGVANGGICFGVFCENCFQGTFIPPSPPVPEPPPQQPPPTPQPPCNCFGGMICPALGGYR
jgi:hypothetical protein